MKLNWLLIVMLLLASLALQKIQGQTLDFKHSFPVSNQLAVSSDTQGNIYLSTPDGEIEKYTAAGQLQHTFSPQSASYFTLLDASQGMQILAFDENRQQLMFLDRFLNPTVSKQLPSQHFNYVSGLGWSRGNSLWLLDAGDMQLKKWQTDRREPMLSLPLNRYLDQAPVEIRQLKEHQHRLYLLGAEQAYVFDQLGNFEKQLKLPPWKSATFLQDELFLLGEGKLEVINLYNGQARSIPLPEECPAYQHLLLNKEKVYLFASQQADVYQLRP